MPQAVWGPYSGVATALMIASSRGLIAEAIISDRSAPQKHVWRAKIILATADGCGTAEIMRRSGKSKPVVWRWQARFMAEGIEGLTLTVRRAEEWEVAP